MHILDIILYFPLFGLIWETMDKLSDGDLTQEIGGIIGCVIMLIYSIIYVILFWVIDYNWVDIFNGLMTVDIKTIL